MYKFVLFDMDGTVLNTIEDIHRSVNQTMRHFGYPEKTLSETKHNTGNASRNLILKSCPEGADVEEALSYYVPYYQAHCNEHTKPYDGIIELMAKLRADGIKTAVVSNKMDGAVKELASKWFDGLLDVAVGETEGYNRKPSPDLVLKAAQEMGADLSQSVYVGDTEVDILTARNSGIPCIEVTWGFRDKEEIINLGADVYCDNCDEVYEAIVGSSV